jgi:hypothetical protein
MTSTSSRAPDLRPLRQRLDELAIDHAATLEQAIDRLYQAGLTDGLPIIPPTDARIAAMLAHCRHDEHWRLDPLPPAFAAPSLWEVAACLVMAGGEVAYLPVLVAALRAVADPSFNLLGIQTTTGSAAPMLIVNGPIAPQLAINAGPNCLGQGWRANATLGRSLRLVLQNVGAAVPGIGDMATQGQPGKFTWCLAENEAESPWPPLHGMRGIPSQTSAVTVVGAAGSMEVVLSSDDPDVLIARLARALEGGGNVGQTAGHEIRQAVVLLPPESAHFLHAHGWIRNKLADEIIRRLEQTAISSQAGDAAATHQGPGEGRDDILLVVAGGTGIKATVVPAWSGATRAVTRIVEPV